MSAYVDRITLQGKRSFVIVAAACSILFVIGRETDADNNISSALFVL